VGLRELRPPRRLELQVVAGFGAGGADLNGRDLFYDGSGKDNCWGPNQTLSPSEAAGAQFVACPFSGQNTVNPEGIPTVLKWSVDPQETHWIKHPHAAQAGYSPLEHYVKGQTPMEQPSR
jgi:hypothetical protein